MKDGGFREKIYRAADDMDLWGYSGFGLPRIEMEGDRIFSIEDHSGLLEYGPEVIKVAAGELVVTVNGMDMEIVSMEKGSLTVRGSIAQVSLSR